MSKVKSNLLFALSANNMLQGKGEEAFVQGVQAFHAREEPPTGAGPHALVFHLLYYVFESFPGPKAQEPVHRLLAMNNPGVAIPSSENDTIKRVAKREYGNLDHDLLTEAAEVLRSRLRAREQRGRFSSFY